MSKKILHFYKEIFFLMVLLSPIAALAIIVITAIMGPAILAENYGNGMAALYILVPGFLAIVMPLFFNSYLRLAEYFEKKFNVFKWM